MGMAMWKTEETYKDMQHITKKMGEDVYTALSNPNLNKCTDQECDGKLVRICRLPTFSWLIYYWQILYKVWQQVSGGTTEVFNMIPAYTRHEIQMYYFQVRS